MARSVDTSISTQVQDPLNSSERSLAAINPHLNHFQIPLFPFDGWPWHVHIMYTSLMLSRDDLDRLKIWQLQLKGAVAAQEHRLESLERHILTTGTVPERAAPFVRSLETAIVVCKNTLTQFEDASIHIATLIDFYDRQVNDTSLPLGHRRLRRASAGANLLPKLPLR